MSQVLIIDGNNLAYRAYYALKSLSTQDGVGTSCLYGGLRIVKSLIQRFQPDGLFICWDSHRHKKRMELLPEYKQKRRDKQKVDDDREDFFRQKDLLIKAFTHLGVSQIKSPGHEADDLIYVLSRRFKTRDVVIVSTDKDFRALIKPGLSVWDDKSNSLYTHENFQKIFKLSPRQYLDYLILDGDKSDNIPGVRGFGEKTIKKFLSEFGSISAFYNSDKEFKNLKTPENEGIINRNKLLIDLRAFYRIALRGDKDVIQFITSKKRPYFDWQSFIIEVVAPFSMKSLSTKGTKRLFRDQHTRQRHVI